jgi:hypothetical protein
MMASWKSKHVAKYCLKLQKYFINCCVETVFNKEIYIINQQVAFTENSYNTLSLQIGLLGTQKHKHRSEPPFTMTAVSSDFVRYSELKEP